MNSKRGSNGQFMPHGERRMTRQERIEKYAPAQRLWQKENPEKMAAAREAWLARPENHKKRLAWRRQYEKRRRDELKAAVATRPRPSGCESCGDPPMAAHRLELCFDHDHTTGAFRGWLCFRCNSALGFLLDDPKRIEALAAYLAQRTETP
jgi:hypothetical protein